MPCYIRYVAQASRCCNEGYLYRAHFRFRLHLSSWRLLHTAQKNPKRSAFSLLAIDINVATLGLN